MVEKKEKKKKEKPAKDKVKKKKSEIKKVEKKVKEKKTVPTKKEKPTVQKVVEEEIVTWTSKTNLGKAVMRGEVTDIVKILDEGIKIKEPEIIDRLIPGLENELVLIGGRPGKGGGIERTPLRMSAKMHGSGRRYTSTAFAIVGNKDGIIGIGKGRGKEGRQAVGKAIEKAKLNVIKIPRGCGSWECGCGEPHSIPYKTKGKSGSVRVTLMPAPRGIGLAVDDESKKILRLAGITDVWGRTQGNTGTRINLITAVFNALKNLHRYKKSK